LTAILPPSEKQSDQVPRLLTENGSRSVIFNRMPYGAIHFEGIQAMKKFVILAGLALTLGAGPCGFAHAATVQPYQQPAFEAAQQSGGPVLIFVEASWCPTCAKERPILQQLYATPEFAHLQVFDVDFDTSKPLLRQLGVQMQSTLIVFHGSKETGRMTGATDPAAIKRLLETSAS
jgi:thioredoxin 1